MLIILSVLVLIYYWYIKYCNLVTCSVSWTCFNRWQLSLGLGGNFDGLGDGGGGGGLGGLVTSDEHDGPNNHDAGSDDDED